MQYWLLFHDNNCYANASQCYVYTYWHTACSEPASHECWSDPTLGCLSAPENLNCSALKYVRNVKELPNPDVRWRVTNVPRYEPDIWPWTWSLLSIYHGGRCSMARTEVKLKKASFLTSQRSVPTPYSDDYARLVIRNSTWWIFQSKGITACIVPPATKTWNCILFLNVLVSATRCSL